MSKTTEKNEKIHKEREKEAETSNEVLAEAVVNRISTDALASMELSASLMTCMGSFYQMLFRDVDLWTKMLEYLPFQQLATNILLADGICSEKDLKEAVLADEIAGIDLRRQHLVQNYRRIGKENQRQATASTEQIGTKRNHEHVEQYNPQTSKRNKPATYSLDSPFDNSDEEHKESEMGVQTPTRRQPKREASSVTYDGYYGESFQQELLRSRSSSTNASRSIRFQADRANLNINSAESSNANQITATRLRPTTETLIEVIKPEPVGPNTTPLLEDSSDLPSYLAETQDIFFPLSYDTDYLQKNQLANVVPDISPTDDRKINMTMLLDKLEQKISREARLKDLKAKFVDRFYPSRSTNPATQHQNVALTTISTIRDWIRRRDPDVWYRKRVKHIRMVDPATLEPRAERWLFEMLEYQCRYRWEIYLRMFAFLVSPSKLKGPFWSAFRANITRGKCAEQQKRGKLLQAQADQLVKEELLPANILFDPVFFVCTSTTCPLYPLDFADTLLEGMEKARLAEPARTFWVDAPDQHPFFRLKLDEIYPHKYAVPWKPVIEPHDGPIAPLYQAFLSNTIRLPSEVQFYSKLSARVRQNLDESSFKSYKTRVLLHDNQSTNTVSAQAVSQLVHHSAFSPNNVDTGIVQER